MPRAARPEIAHSMPAAVMAQQAKARDRERALQEAAGRDEDAAAKQRAEALKKAQADWSSELAALKGLAG